MKYVTSVIALGGSLICASPAFAQTETTTAMTGELPPSVEMCIRDNASKVEAQFDSLKDGVDFLVGYVCAGPIAAEQKRQQQAFQESIHAMWKKQCDEKTQSGATSSDNKTDNKTGVDPCVMQKNMETSAALLPMLAINALAARPAYAVSLASELLLDARTARRHAKDR